MNTNHFLFSTFLNGSKSAAELAATSDRVDEINPSFSEPIGAIYGTRSAVDVGDMAAAGGGRKDIFQQTGCTYAAVTHAPPLAAKM